VQDIKKCRSRKIFWIRRMRSLLMQGFCNDLDDGDNAMMCEALIVDS
jgi:hypothetical protein